MKTTVFQHDAVAALAWIVSYGELHSEFWETRVWQRFA